MTTSRNPRIRLGALTTPALLAASITLATGCASAPRPGISGAPNTQPPAQVSAGSGVASQGADFTQDQWARIEAVQAIVAARAAEHELDPALVNAVIWVESRFQPQARSPAGARGLMQLMPATAAALAKQLQVSRPRAHDPAFNVQAGTYYLAKLREKFDGDETLALAAYHAGPGNVRKWLDAGEGLPDFSQAYVAKVLEAKARFEGRQVPAAEESLPPTIARAEPHPVSHRSSALKPNPMRAADPPPRPDRMVPEPAAVPNEVIFERAAQLDPPGTRRLPGDWREETPVVPITQSPADHTTQPDAEPPESAPKEPDSGAGVLPDL